MVTASWWVFRGFSVKNGQSLIRNRNANNNIYDGILCDGSGNEAVLFDGTSSNNIFRNSTVRNTGNSVPGYGEGIYIGNGATGADPSNNNQILNNTLGPNIRAEHIDVKSGSTGNLIQGNVSDATGFIESHSGQFTTTIYGVAGTNQQVRNNTITNAPTALANGFQTFTGSNNSFHGNRVTGSFQFGYKIDGGSGIVGCDNIAVGGPFSNVGCQ
jgi:hypothetical protein